MSLPAGGGPSSATAAAAGGLAGYAARTFHRAGIATLPDHLGRHCGIRVSAVTELDVGVIRARVTLRRQAEPARHGDGGHARVVAAV